MRSSRPAPATGATAWSSHTPAGPVLSDRTEAAAPAAHWNGRATSADLGIGADEPVYLAAADFPELPAFRGAGERRREIRASSVARHASRQSSRAVADAPSSNASSSVDPLSTSGYLLKHARSHDRSARC